MPTIVDTEGRRVIHRIDDRSSTRQTPSGLEATWADPDIRQRRQTRDGVTVEVEGAAARAYKSTRAAWDALDLPPAKCIPFRIKLKAEGSLVFENDGLCYLFKIVNGASTPQGSPWAWK